MVGSIVIVGGGASGILLAAHLLRRSGDRLQVTLVEKRGQLGRGVAFSSSEPEHILNVPAGNMSAYADEPDHFRTWLTRVHPELPADPFLFAPRRVYGEYLADVLRRSAAGASDAARLTVVTARAVGLRTLEHGVEIALDNGTARFAEVAVLAVGHEELPSNGRGIAVRVGSDEDTPLDSDAEVLILGSGLSMVDAWLSLNARGHRGLVTIVSRHGLLPLSHRQVAPIGIAEADVPFGESLGRFTSWLRAFAAANAARGGDWRSVVDGLRPYNQRIWQSWPPAARRQFLEHVRPLWNVHRHRLPPHLHTRMEQATDTGRLTIVAGKLVRLDRRADHIAVTFRRRGQDAPETRSVARVYDCGGITLDVETSSNPAILSLLAQGLARPDERRIGLDVTTGLNVVDATGTPSPRLFAVGPLTRGKFFEIEAIPDIRRQVADLAARLIG